MAEGQEHPPVTSSEMKPRPGWVLCLCGGSWQLPLGLGSAPCSSSVFLFWLIDLLKLNHVPRSPPIYNVGFSGFYYIYRVVQPLPHHFWAIFHLSGKETLCPLVVSLLSSGPCSPWQPPVCFLSLGLPLLGISFTCTWFWGRSLP